MGGYDSPHRNLASPHVFRLLRHELGNLCRNVSIVVRYRTRQSEPDVLHAQ